MSRSNSKGGGGCAALVAGVLVIGLIVLALSALGHFLGLTPSPSEVTDKPDGWVERHYEGVVVGYVLTILLLLVLGGLVFAGVRSASEDPAIVAAARPLMKGLGVALAGLVLAIVVLPVGERENAEGNVPSVIGQNAASATDEIENASLGAEFAQDPIDDERCRVVDQAPRGGGELDEYEDVRLRCVVAVPRVVGRRAETAQSRIEDAGLNPAWSTSLPTMT